MQGWSPDFIPKLTGDAVDMKVIDRVITHRRRRTRCGAAASSRRRKASSSASPSGATLRRRAAGRARDAPKGSTMLCMLPDTGERYLSTPLFADIPADMTEEELAISRSTPSARFDGEPSPPASRLTHRAAVPPLPRCGRGYQERDPFFPSPVLRERVSGAQRSFPAPASREEGAERPWREAGEGLGPHRYTRTGRAMFFSSCSPSPRSEGRACPRRPPARAPRRRYLRARRCLRGGPRH